MRRWVSGYVTATAQGGLPERFLNLANETDVAIWDTRREGITLVFRCAAGEYRRLRPVARRCGMRMRVCRRAGLPFLVRPFRKRWGLTVGVVAVAVLLQVLSARIWMISVSGNERVTDEEILSVLRPLGIVTGGDFDEVDIPTVQLTAVQQLEEIRWLSVSVRGSHVYVQVKEREATAPIADTAPANIVSVCDGVVVSVRVTDGVAVVKEGDAVTADTLLISGVTDSTVGPILRRAQGEIVARVVVERSVTVPLVEERPAAEPTIHRRRTAVLFGWEIPLLWAAPDGEYTVEESVRCLRANGKDLPIGVRTTAYVMSESETVTRTEEEAREEAYRRLTQQIENVEPTLTVENEEVVYTVSGDAVTAVGRYTGTCSIGVVQPIG